MENKRKNIKGLARALVFVIIFVFLFIQVSNILMPKVKDDATDTPVNMISSSKILEKDTVDVIFLGNSNAYRGINPIKIWLDKKITACVIGNSFITEPELYYRAKDILKTQSPKYIILETDCMFETGNSFDENGYLNFTVPEEKDKLGISEVKSKLNDCETDILSVINSKYPLMKFNYRWKKINLGELKNASNKKAFTSKGFLTSKSKEPFKYGDTYMAIQNNDKEPFDDISLKYFYKILDLCKEKDIKLALVTVPSGNTWNMAKHRSVSELAEKNGLDYVDFNTETDLIPDFDWETDSKDGGNHLNNTGARKVTAAYAKILAEEYGLTKSDLTDEQKEKWNNDADIFCQKNFGKSIYDK